MSINLEPSSGDAFFYALEILSSFHQPGAAQAQDSQPEGATTAAQPVTEAAHDEENDDENDEDDEENNDENRDENRDPVTLTRAPTNVAAARPQGTIRSILGASNERPSRGQSNGRLPLSTIYLAPGEMPTFPRFPSTLEISHISGHDELVLR